LRLARLLQQQGRHEEARPPLAEVFGRFTEEWRSPDLREAEAMLGRTTYTPAHRAARP